LVAANIPWKKLQNTEFRLLLEKYTKKHIPDESTLRKTYLGPCYQNVISQIRDEVGDSYIWISVDETTDINGRFIANLIIGVLHRLVLGTHMTPEHMEQYIVINCFMRDT